MKELTGNGEPRNKVSLVKQILSILLAMAFLFSIDGVAEYFERYLNFYVFLFFWILLYLVINQLLMKKKNQPFDFKALFRAAGILFLGLLILYNL